MQTIGFLISHKNNEKRRAILPKQTQKICISKQAMENAWV